MNFDTVSRALYLLLFPFICKQKIAILKYSDVQKVKVTYDMRQTINSLFFSHSFFNRFKGFQCMSWDHFYYFVYLLLFHSKKDFKKIERLLLRKLNRKLIKNIKYYQKTIFLLLRTYSCGIKVLYPLISNGKNLYSFNVVFNYCEYFSVHFCGSFFSFEGRSINVYIENFASFEHFHY